MPLMLLLKSTLPYVPRRLGVWRLPSCSSSMSRSRWCVLAECEWPCRDMDDRGRLSGVRVDVRDMGLGGAMSVREGGRAYEDMLARELGRLLSASGARFGSGPNDRRFMLEVLSLGTWPCRDEADGR